MSQTPPRHHAPGNSPLSQAQEDYLKSIFALARDGNKVTTQALADRLGVSAASVTNMVKRLADLKLVEYERYQGVSLTEPGRKVAVEMLRHHRLLELYLTQALGYSWDEVHDEAELLEHFISEKLEARIAEALGNPNFDPHGAPIPTLEGELPQTESLSLLQQDLHRELEITRVTDTDGEILKELAKKNLVPGVSVMVLGRPPTGLVHLKVGRQECLVSPTLCRHVRALPVEDGNIRAPAEHMLPGETAPVYRLRGSRKRELERMGLKEDTLLERLEKGFSFEGVEDQLGDEFSRSILVSLSSEP